MAVAIGDFVSEVKEEVSFNELRGRTIAVDAYNTIYQFLSIIRGPDGSPLTDSKGRVTSHLSGLFYRTINILEYEVTPVFVFDGIPPALKQRTLEARMNQRKTALEEWNKAKAEGQIEEARNFAMKSTKINKDIVASAKELLECMGVPYIQAPSEGEAQAAKLVSDGLAYAAASQDYDSFLFGSDIVIRNLTVTGRRKLPRKNVYVDVNIERTCLKKLLASMGLDLKQLIWVGMLIGTDFNEGIKGVGPKTALRIVRERKSLKEIVSYVQEKYGTGFGADPEDVEKVFTEPEVKSMSSGEFERILKANRPNKEKLIRFMCDEHEFSTERIDKYSDKLTQVKGKAGQKGINSWM